MPIFFRPGSQLKPFTAYRDHSTVSGKGRVSNTGDPEKIDQFKATLADAAPSEVERWKQIDHPITHVIVQRGTSKAQAGDYLMFGSRKFYLQGATNPGEMGFYTIYYAQEKEGKG